MKYRGLKFLISLVSCGCLLACTTLTPVNVRNAHEILAPGDKVELVMSSGEKFKFKVEAVTPEGIVGGGHQLAWADVSSLQREKLDGTKTGLLILGVVAIAAAAASGGSGGGGSGSGY